MTSRPTTNPSPPTLRDAPVPAVGVCSTRLGLVGRDQVGRDSGLTAVTLQLCACCASVAVPATSSLASLHCPECGEQIVAANRAAGRLVVPVAADPDVNCVLFPLPADDAEEACGIHRFTRNFDRQVAHLRTWRRMRTRALLVRLRLVDREWVPLDEFLQGVRSLPPPAFQPATRSQILAQNLAQNLVAWFAEYLLEVPESSPLLRARIRSAARAYVRSLPEDDLERLRYARPQKLDGLARAWARQAIPDVLPVPPVLDFTAPALDARRAPTRRALAAAAIREFDRVWRRYVPPDSFHSGPQKPVVPVPVKIACPPPGFGVYPYVSPDADHPEWLPRKRPRSARLALALENPPAPLARPVTHLFLSMDSRHRFWILWAEWMDEAGRDVTAPAGFGPRGGLAEVEAAYLTLEVFLGRLKMRRGLTQPPKIALTGLLGDALVADLLERVWPPDREAAT